MSNPRPSGYVRLKRSPDYWEVRAYHGRDPVSGKRIYAARCIRGTRKQAQRLLASLVASTPTDAPSAVVSLAQLLGHYVAFGETRGLSPTTLARYAALASDIGTDVIGLLHIDRLRPLDCDTFYMRLAKRGLSAATINRYHSLINGALNQACKWEWIPRNPAKLATPPTERRAKRRLPDASIVEDLIAQAAATKNPANAVAIRFKFASGVRCGELCARRWADLDPVTGMLRIHSSVAELPDGELRLKAPKDYQERTIQIDPATVESLYSLRAEQERIARTFGIELSPDAFMFANQNPHRRGNPDGTRPSRPSRLGLAFRRLTHEVPGAKGLRLHDLRHLSATCLIEDGESLPNVAQRLGHRLETLVRIYGHETTPDAEAAARLGARAGKSHTNPFKRRCRKAKD